MMTLMELDQDLDDDTNGTGLDLVDDTDGTGLGS